MENIELLQIFSTALCFVFFSISWQHNLKQFLKTYFTQAKNFAGVLLKNRFDANVAQNKNVN